MPPVGSSYLYCEGRASETKRCEIGRSIVGTATAVCPAPTIGTPSGTRNANATTTASSPDLVSGIMSLPSASVAGFTGSPATTVDQIWTFGWSCTRRNWRSVLRRLICTK
eukprot:Amastigsp_a511886_79.p6 type:complete len:110 gc:universal Amastigsp_a511886_79:1850-1521(-)